MTDWFGEAPVEMRELLPSHYSNWQPFCGFCDKESAIYYEGKYLCIDHAEEVMMEIFDNE